MELSLDKDIVFFDIEATGLHIIRDRIIQIAIIKYFKNGNPPQELDLLINPGVPITEEALKVISIKPEHLRNKPSFAQVGQQIFDFIGNADLGGYGMNRMDIPMLIEEFARIGLDFDISKRKKIDAQRIFYKMEPRTLTAALKFYCSEEIEGAHDAMADVKATIAVLKGQLKRYENTDFVDADGTVIENPIQNNMKALHNFTNDINQIDPTQKLKYDANGTVVFSFGKYMGKPVGETLFKDKQYYNWILNKEFSHQVKQMVKKITKEYAKNR